MQPRRIAIIKPSALGDIAHTLPVLTALRRQFPQSHLTWIINSSYESLIKDHPDLNQTIAFQRSAFRGVASSLRYLAEFQNRLRRERFDLVLDLQGLLRTGLMTAFTGAPRKIGFSNAREGASFFYNELVGIPNANELHAVDRYWKMVEQIGAGRQSKIFHLPVSPYEQTLLKNEIQSLPKPYIVIAVGSRWVTKLWRPVHFAVLAQRAQHTFGGTVFFVGTTEDRLSTTFVASALRGPVRDMTGRTTLPRLVALLSLADVMIANDTGPLHLAAALGRPCIAPYTCTMVRRHGPYAAAGAGVETSVACGGSYLKRCPHGMVCMDDLTPEKLWPPLERVLSSWAERCHSA